MLVSLDERLSGQMLWAALVYSTLLAHLAAPVCSTALVHLAAPVYQIDWAVPVYSTKLTRSATQVSSKNSTSLHVALLAFPPLLHYASRPVIGRQGSSALILSEKKLEQRQIAPCGHPVQKSHHCSDQYSSSSPYLIKLNPKLYPSLSGYTPNGKIDSSQSGKTLNLFWAYTLPRVHAHSRKAYLSLQGKVNTNLKDAVARTQLSLCIPQATQRRADSADFVQKQPTVYTSCYTETCRFSRFCPKTANCVYRMLHRVISKPYREGLTAIQALQN